MAKITHLHVDFVYLGVDLLPLVSDLLGVLLDGAQVLFGLLQLGSSLVEGLGEKVLADGELLSGLLGIVPAAGDLLQLVRHVRRLDTSILEIADLL